VGEVLSAADIIERVVAEAAATLDRTARLAR
jgi:hypothetical protein